MIYFKIEDVVVFIMYLWVWWSPSVHVKAANDSLKLGDTLSATTELCSKQGKYCISFCPKPYYKDVTYLHIYPGVKDDWIVWVANRNQPVDPNSAVLLLDRSGVLKIESKSMEPIILYSSPRPFDNTTVATLLDTGNFVVQTLQPNGIKSTVLWQSFDDAPDSLIPGMKLGVNHKTGHNWTLASWLSPSTPTLGTFRLEWEPRRRELVIKKREQVYWTSGKLRKKRFEHISSDQVRFIIVSNKDEESVTFTTLKEEVLTIWSLLETGQLINRGGEGGNNIARADLCYGYNTNGGCQKWEEKPIPPCRNLHDVFEPTTGYPNYEMSNDIRNANYSISDCHAICWSNCSCHGFKSLYDNGTGCSFLLSMKGFNTAAGGSAFYTIVRNSQSKGKSTTIFFSNFRPQGYIIHKTVNS